MHFAACFRELRLLIEDDGRGNPKARPAGYGLSGVQRRVERLGGQASFGNRPAGAIFVEVALPRQSESAASLPVAPQAGVRGVGRRKRTAFREPTPDWFTVSTSPTRVLVVEDDARFRARLVTLLTAHGFEIQEAASGAEAVRVLAHFQADVCLIDLGLPDTTGEALIPQLLRKYGRMRRELGADGSLDAL